MSAADLDLSSGERRQLMSERGLPVVVYPVVFGVNVHRVHVEADAVADELTGGHFAATSVLVDGLAKGWADAHGQRLCSAARRLGHKTSVPHQEDS